MPKVVEDGKETSVKLHPSYTCHLNRWLINRLVVGYVHWTVHVESLSPDIHKRTDEVESRAS